MLLLESVTPLTVGELVASCKIEGIELEDNYEIVDNLPDDTTDFAIVESKIVTVPFTDPKTGTLSSIITLALQRKKPKGFSEPIVDSTILNYNLVKVLNDDLQTYETHLIVNLYVQGQTSLVNEFSYGEENIDGSITIYDTVVNWDVEDKEFNINDYEEFKRVLFDIYKLLKGMVLKQKDVEGYVKRFNHLLENEVNWKDDVENVLNIKDSITKTEIFQDVYKAKITNIETEFNNIKDTYKEITALTTDGKKRLTTLNTDITSLQTFITTLVKEINSTTITDVSIDQKDFDKAIKTVNDKLSNIWKLIAYVEQGYGMIIDMFAEAQEITLTSQNPASVLSGYITNIKSKLDPYEAVHLLLQDYLFNDTGDTTSLTTTDNTTLEGKIVDTNVKKVLDSVKSTSLNNALNDLQTTLLDLKKTTLTSLGSIITTTNNAEQWIVKLDNKITLVETIKNEIEDNIEIYKTLTDLLIKSYATVNNLISELTAMSDRFHHSLDSIVMKLRFYYKNKQHFMLTLRRIFLIKDTLDKLSKDYAISSMSEYSAIEKTVNDIKTNILPTVESIIADTESALELMRENKVTAIKKIDTLITDLTDLSDSYKVNVEAIETNISTSRLLLATITDTISDLLKTKADVINKQLSFNLKKDLDKQTLDLTFENLDAEFISINNKVSTTKEQLKHLDRILRSIGQNITNFTISS